MSPLPPGPTICSMWRPPLLGFQGHSGVMACWAAVSAPRVTHDPPENSTMRVRPGRPRLRGAQLQTVGGAGRFPSGDVRARGKSKTRRPKEGPAGRTLRAPRPPGLQSAGLRCGRPAAADQPPLAAPRRAVLCFGPRPPTPSTAWRSGQRATPEASSPATSALPRPTPARRLGAGLGEPGPAAGPRAGVCASDKANFPNTI